MKIVKYIVKLASKYEDAKSNNLRINVFRTVNTIKTLYEDCEDNLEEIRKIDGINTYESEIILDKGRLYFINFNDIFKYFFIVLFILN